MTPREQLLEGLPIRERKLTVCGVSTALLEAGDGPFVVLLHGPGESAAKWFRVIADLARTHRVVAPDLPGHGESSPMEGPAARALDWLDALLASTNTTAATLVGHVLGGAIAARFAAKAPARVGTLILVDSLGLAPFEPAPQFGAALAAFLAQPDDTTHDLLWDRCAFDLQRLRATIGDRWHAMKSYNLDRARVPALRAYQHSLMAEFGFRAIAPERLAAIDVATRLIWGGHDLATPLPVAQAAAARYGWPLYVIDQAGDDPAIEQPAEFTRALRAALAHESIRARETASGGA